MNRDGCRYGMGNENPRLINKIPSIFVFDANKICLGLNIKKIIAIKSLHTRYIMCAARVPKFHLPTISLPPQLSSYPFSS